MYWNPFDEMEKMQKDMNRVFSTYREKMPSTSSMPAMDLIDNGQELVAILDLPGVKKEDIEIDCGEDYLKISAGSKHKVEEKKKGYYFAERSASQFVRETALPVKVIPEKCTSTYKNGVLEIKMPKREKTQKPKGHKVKVE